MSKKERKLKRRAQREKERKAFEKASRRKITTDEKELAHPAAACAPGTIEFQGSSTELCCWTPLDKRAKREGEAEQSQRDLHSDHNGVKHDHARPLRIRRPRFLM